MSAVLTKQGRNHHDNAVSSHSHLLVNRSGNLLNIGDGEIISHNLEVLPVLVGELGPVRPVVLIEGVLDRDDGEVLGELRARTSEVL